jgi:biopolymer transport protein ExbD
MRIKSRSTPSFAGFDLTPMIDMAFQLIAFFMVLLNFTEAEQDQRINLPASELAKPPEEPFEEPRTIQLTRDGKVLFSGRESTVGPQLERLLIAERQVLQRAVGKDPTSVTIIIRADESARTGLVQQIMRLCQQVGFSRFALRAKQTAAPLPEQT